MKNKLREEEGMIHIIAIVAMLGNLIREKNTDFHEVARNSYAQADAMMNQGDQAEGKNKPETNSDDDFPF